MSTSIGFIVWRMGQGLAAQARRWRWEAGGLVLYSAMALAVLSPLAPDAMPFSGADDVANHVSGIIEARNALAEGQFPIRVAPRQNLGTRYPIFQFYGNFPYTLGGLLHRSFGLCPYRAWKLVVLAALVTGAFFTWACGRRLTRQPMPALLAGAMFLTAPYLLTDVHGRFAYPEVVSFGLLPAVFFFSLRCLAARGIGSILAGGVCWSLLATSHHVTYVYASLFFGLFFLAFLRPRKRAVGRLVRVGAAYGLGLCLTAWYLAPQQRLVPHLCGGLLFPVMDSAWLTHLGALLAPTVVSPVHLPSIYIACPEHFGLQVGWPILASVGLALCCFRSPLARSEARRSFLALLLFFFFLSLFMVWSPVDFWRALPTLFAYVQFSYRLLMFVVLWGCLLAPYAVALAFPGRMRPGHLALGIVALGTCASPYVMPHRKDNRISVAKEIAHPEMGRGGAGVVYNLSDEALLATTLVHPAVEWVEAPFGILDPMAHATRSVVAGAFPPLRPGDVLLVEGAIVEGGSGPTPLSVCVDGELLAVRHLPPGPFRLAIPVSSEGREERSQVRIRSPLRSEPPPEGPITRPVRKPPVFLTRLALQRGPDQPGSRPLVPASVTRLTAVPGLSTSLAIRAPTPSLVQLPILFYPDVLRVTVNGERVQPRNLGRFVAVELPAGDHRIAVRFVGLRWANALSLAGWVVVGGGLALLLLRRLVRAMTAAWRARASAIPRPLPQENQAA